METDSVFANAAKEGCGCCVIGTETAGYGCSDRSAIFTPREQLVLRRIRESADRARELRDRLERITDEGGNREEKERSLFELKELRHLRSELEAERIAAAEERMRILGHA